MKPSSIERKKEKLSTFVFEYSFKVRDITERLQLDDGNGDGEFLDETR